MQFIDFINLSRNYLHYNGHIYKMWGIPDVRFTYKCL